MIKPTFLQSLSTEETSGIMSNSRLEQVGTVNHISAKVNEIIDKVNQQQRDITYLKNKIKILMKALQDKEKV